MGAWVTKMDGRERRYMSGVSAVWALSGEMGFVLERGNRKRCIYVKHQRAGWQLVKQMRDRIPEKGKKKNTGQFGKNKKHTTERKDSKDEVCLYVELRRM